MATGALVRRLVVPRLLREARDRGWWDPLDAGGAAGDQTTGAGQPTILASVDRAIWARLTVAPGVIAPTDPSIAHALVAAGLRDGLRATVAVHDATVVGAAISIGNGRADLLALGVAPAWRRAGLAGRLLAAHVGEIEAVAVELHTEVTVAERDPLDPLDGGLRRTIAGRLLERAGFHVTPADAAVRGADPSVVTAVRRDIGVAS